MRILYIFHYVIILVFIILAFSPQRERYIADGLFIDSRWAASIFCPPRQVLGFFLRAWNQFTVAMEVNLKCWSAYEGRAVVSVQMGNQFAALQDINTAIEVVV